MTLAPDPRVPPPVAPTEGRLRSRPGGVGYRERVRRAPACTAPARCTPLLSPGPGMKRMQRSKSDRTTLTIAAYHAAQSAAAASMCRRLRAEIDRALPAATSKVWHGAPVWFIGQTPVVGYNVAARGDVVLLFWNGQAFDDPALTPIGKFRAAQARFGDAAAIEVAPLRRWLKKAGTKLWDIHSIRRLRSRATRRD